VISWSRWALKFVDRCPSQIIGKYGLEEQPDLLARLNHTFGRGHALGQDEQDHVSTTQYGERFIEAIETAVRSGHDHR
jgi:hypothetical protein